VNQLAPEEARQALARCCGSSRWVAAMLSRRPFLTTAALYAAAEEVWGTLARTDLLEAFASHPRIGDRATSAWSAEEQARAAAGGAETTASLRALNDAYAARFGYIFIICATGKSADEVLAALRARLENDAETELKVAAAEQALITRLRLEKLAL
jgi:OHCU decarboxylase